MAIPPVSPFSQQPGGGIVTAMRGGNALSESFINNRIKGSAADYAPYTNYANALSKIAYGQMAPAQALATFMSSPAASNLTREQRIAMGEQMQNYLKNYNATTMIPAPQPNKGFSLGEFGGNILNKLGDTLGLTSSSPAPNSLKQMPTAPTQGRPQSNPGGNNQEYGAVNQATPEYAQNIADNGNNAAPIVGTGVQNLPFNKAANDLPVPGSQGGNTPEAGSKAQESRIIKGVEGEVAAQNKMWETKLVDSAKEANIASEADKLIDKFEDSYDRLGKWRKGSVLGDLPPWFSDEATSADTTAKTLAASVARANQQGHITDSNFKAFERMKISRSMPEQTMKDAANFMRGVNERAQEHLAFNIAAQKSGLTSQEADGVWLSYINKNPFYSVRNHELLENNFNKWPEYLTKSKVDEALRPNAGNNRARESSKENIVKIYSPEGKLVATGPRENAERFIKAHSDYSIR